MLDITLSGKLSVLNSIIRDTINCRQKIVIFSQSLACLDHISLFLTKGILVGPNSSEKYWIQFKHFYRIDGNTPLSQRTNYINLFNDRNNHTGVLMLISIRSGGLGVNLRGASRVALVDCSWNPS
uniref:Helicase C-terminal domain-containing protein n=1 Tax=Anguilla anguilla TaxID=7936 RepID=A0A0E9SFS8_ANGAN